MFQRFATSIGLVESGGRNLRRGDADSVNFRQERASVYGPAWKRSGGPYNTRAIVGRLVDEFRQQYDPGENAAQVAAQVQRPAGQFRGRYAQAMPEARELLRGARRQAGGAGGQPGLQALLAGGGGQGGMPEASGGLVELLGALGQQKPQIQSAGVQAPEFAAGPALAGQVPSSSGGPAPKPDIGALLETARTAGGAVGGSAGRGGGGRVAAGDRERAAGCEERRGGRDQGGDGAHRRRARPVSVGWRACCAAGARVAGDSVGLFGGGVAGVGDQPARVGAV